jgi:ABC-type polysaccharide/polyol phosphate export permease
MGRLGEYTYWNPFANFIEIVRMPVLYGTVDSSHWVYVGVFSLIGALIGIATFALGRHRIVYWV